MNRHVLAMLILLTALATPPVGALPQASPASGVIDAPRLLEDLRVLASGDMQGRRVDTPGGAKARAYVIERFRALGVAPFGSSYEQAFTFKNASSDVHGVNVIGRIAGASQPNRYIVVSAHYDHLGVRNGQTFYGADDNASGTAALFSIAKYFSTNRPAHSLLIAAFDAEESGLAGSKAFLRQPPVDAAALAVDLNADMVGRDSRNTLYVTGVFTQPFLKAFVTRIAAVAPVRLIMGHDDPAERGVEDWTRDSDHFSFMQAKIPALYFGVEDFDRLHQPTDTFETMTPDFYVRAVETLVLAIKDFDGNLDSLPKR